MPNIIFKKRALATYIAMSSMAAVSANAQDDFEAEDVDTEEVVVTGIRASIERAMDIKRESKGVVDAISAEDIGKFPDSNIAESLQRITGVSIDRSNGEGSQVTVRGFGPQYNLITLNGRSMPATMLNPEGGLINQRSFDMSNIASEGVAGVEVYKTGKANISSGGIGSAINLKTRRPFDNPGLKFSVGGKALKDTTNIAGNAVTPELSGFISWTDDNDMFGASASVSYQERDSAAVGMRPSGWDNFAGPYTTADDVIPNGLTSDFLGSINEPAAGTQTNFNNGPAYYRADYERIRKNAQVTLQYRPIESVTTTLDYTYAEQETLMNRSGTSFWFGGGAFPTKAVQYDGNSSVATPIYWWTENQNFTTNPEYDDTAATRDIAYGLQRGHIVNELESVGFNVEWNATDRLSFSLDVHDSTSKSLPGNDVGSFYSIGMASQGTHQQGIDFSGDLPLLVANIVDRYPTLDHDCDSYMGDAATPNIVREVGAIQLDRDCTDYVTEARPTPSDPNNEVTRYFTGQFGAGDEFDVNDAGQVTGLNGTVYPLNDDGNPIIPDGVNPLPNQIQTGENVVSQAFLDGGEVLGELDKGDVSSTVRQIAYDRAESNVFQMKIDGKFDFSDSLSIDFGMESSSFESIQRRSWDQTPMEGNWSGVKPGDVPSGSISKINYADYFDGYRTDLSAESRAFFDAAAEVSSGGESPQVFMEGWVGDAQAVGETLADNAGLKWGPNASDETDRMITEDIFAAYVQADFSFELAGIPIDILGGLRFENTDVESWARIAPRTLEWQGDNDFNSSAGDSSLVPPEVHTHSYSHVLPALDVAANFTDDMVARVSYSTTIARADYDLLSQGLSGIGGPVGGPTVLGADLGGATNGNVALEPIESNNFDISYEWYYADASYASVGFFYKDVPNFIGTDSVVVQSDVTRDPSAGPRAQQALNSIDPDSPTAQQDLFIAVVGLSSEGNGCVVADGKANLCGATASSGSYDDFENAVDIIATEDDPFTTVRANIPVNKENATLDGLEFAVQHFFGDTGFGASANYTMVNGSVDFDVTKDPSEGQFALVGLGDSANVALMYEGYGFQTRFAWNWRDDFLNATNVGNREPEFTEDYQQLDFTISYNITDQLIVSLEGLNVLEEDSRKYGRTNNQFRRLEIYGARYALSARYTF